METLNITIDKGHHATIFEILKHIRPSWDSDKLVIKELKDGNNNQIYYCAMTNDTEEDDVVLVKVYGSGTEWMDREKEVSCMIMAHSVGVGSPLYCRFQNGLAYKYYRGNTVATDNILDETLNRGIARKLATLHHVDPAMTADRLGRNAVPVILSFIDIVKKWSLEPSYRDFYDDPCKEKVRQMEFPRMADAITQMEMYGKELEEMGFPTCFCHGDPHATNIIYDPTTDDIRLIDWEIAGIDYAVHDIGWYFAGRLLADDCADDGLKFYPDKEYQLKWIRWYLEYRADLFGKAHETISESDIHKIYRGSILCGLMRGIVAVVFFLVKDSTMPSKPEFFRKARYFQRLVRLIEEEYHHKLI